MIGIWTVIAAVIGFGVTAILGKWFIPFLRKVKFGQTIREEGPKWHAKKDGTPTMGGIMFIIGIAVSLAVCLTAFYITQANSRQPGDCGNDPDDGQGHRRIFDGGGLWCHWFY